MNSSVSAPLTYQFAVEMTTSNCLQKVTSALEIDGVLKFEINLEKREVLIESSQSSSDLLRVLEQTGLRTRIIGLGKEGHNQGCAMCALGFIGERPVGTILGIVRFVQLTDDELHIEGTLTGLSPGLHGLHIHEFGDLSSGCLSTGVHYNPKKQTHGAPNSPSHHQGDLGNIKADQDGRAQFRLILRDLNVHTTQPTHIYKRTSLAK